ncbi:MAG: tol-pal system protein YbgF [Thiobacillus sp.]|nr:tol-pal system protein YbgF [Thiobacillus sp.]
MVPAFFIQALPAWGQTPDIARQVQALQQATDSLNERLAKLEGVIQQNQQLLGLLQEVETLKAEVARIRGQAEVQVHQLDTLGKRQNDLYVDLDQRISDLAKAAKPAPVAETAQATVPSPQAPAAPAAPAEAPVAEAAQPSPAPVVATPQLDPLVESRTYETALNHFREANYAGAIAGFKGFLKAYPDSALAPNAQYWIGYSYYALKDYKSALAHQQKLVVAYPTSAKVPDAMLNIASNQIALDDLAGGRKTLEELVDKHSGTNAAKLAARRLAALK